MSVGTERLYYTDSYQSSFDAEVEEKGAEGTRIYLDRTAFYPTSGGQPHDLGTLNGIAVLDVADEGERVAHVLAEPLSDAQVAGCVFWPRRYDHMQQHTGQHLLSAVFQEALGAATVSFHMGSEVSTIDLGMKELSEEQMSSVEDRVNEAARKATGVRISFEDAAEAEGLRKASERSGILRIVTLDGWDKSACGGTHVRNLSEVLPVQLRKMEKMRGNVRVEFVCGERAARAARRDFRVLAQLSRLAGTAPEQAAEHFSALRTRLAEAEKERQSLANQLAGREGLDLYAMAAESPDGLRRTFLRVAKLDEMQRAKANAYGSKPKSVLLLASPDSVLVACSADSGLNAGSMLRAVVALHGGSGGGSATLAQGKLTGDEALLSLAASAGFGKIRGQATEFPA